MVTLMGGRYLHRADRQCVSSRETGRSRHPPGSVTQSSAPIWNRMSSGYNAMTMRRCSVAFDVARIRMLRPLMLWGPPH